MGKTDSSDLKDYQYRMDEIMETSEPVSFTNMVEHIVINYLFNRNWTIDMVGISGTGKNDIIAKAREILGIECILFSGLGMLPEDVGGMPGYDRTLHGDRNKYSDPTDVLYEFFSTEPEYMYYPFNNMKKAFDPEWKGILFVDEIARCEDDTRRKIYQFTYDRELNGRKLSPGCLVVMSMNPPGMAEYNLQPLDRPFEDRVQIFPVKSTVKDWLSFAKGEDAVYDHIRERAKAHKLTRACTSRSRDRKISRSVYEFVRENRGIYSKHQGRRLHHMSDVIIAIEKYFGTDVRNILRNKNRYSHEYDILTEAVSAATSSSTLTEYVVSASVVMSITAEGIASGQYSSGDYADMLKDPGMASNVTKINDDLVGMISDRMPAHISEDMDNDQIVAALEGITDNVILYLKELNLSSPDIALSFFGSLSTAGARWKEFTEAMHNTMTIRHPAFLEQLMENARINIITSPTTAIKEPKRTEKPASMKTMAAGR